MVKYIYKNANKPNLVKLSVNARCHHGIRHPKFLMAKYKCRQRRPVKRCTNRALKCHKLSKAALTKLKEISKEVRWTTPTANGLPTSTMDDDAVSRGTPCDCQENDLSEGYETFSTGEIRYDSFLEESPRPHRSESDSESDSEPLYRSFDAAAHSDTSTCEVITVVNGNRIASKLEKRGEFSDQWDSDDVEDYQDSPIKRPTDTTDSESAGPVPKRRRQQTKVDKRKSPSCIDLDGGIQQPELTCQSPKNVESGQSFAECEWEDLDESRHEQFNKIETDNSPRKRTKPQPEPVRHRIYAQSINSFIMILDHPAKLSLIGKIQISVLWGSLSINGFTLRPQADFTPIYSPSTSSSVIISTYQDGTATHTDNETKAFEDFWNSQDVQLMPNSELKSNLLTTVGLKCKRLSNTACSYVERFYPDIFGIDHLAPGFLTVETADHYGCQFYNAHHSKIRCIHSDKHWKELADDVVKSTKCKDTPPRIIVCGGKRVGKSTLCRYLINTLLNVCDKVSFLDGDPGQSEFTPPGLVSLVERTEPCFGPAFTHLQDAKLSLFVGGTTVSESPSHFIECIDKLWMHYSKNDSKQQPLLINTMGWNKGMGLSLLMDMIHIVQPTHLIQINSQKYQSKNFSSLSLTYISHTPGFVFELPEMKEPYEHYILRSLANDRKDLTQVTTREISLLSYFSRFQASSKFLPLNQLQTIKVPWSTVALHVCHADVLNSQILYVYNASIVSLCRCEDTEIISTADPALPKFIKDMPVSKFVGYGIVRGISMEEKCFYIITSLDAETMKQINSMLTGTIAIPQTLLLDQDVGGIIPYLIQRECTSSLKIGQKSIPKRNFRGKIKKVSTKNSKNYDSPNFMPLMGQPF